MNDQLQELLSKVYEEGVAKANAEVERILGKAQSEAEVILSEANAKATALVEAAQKQADELKKNTEGDVKVASNHSLSALKQKITDLVLLKSVDAGSKASFSEPAFVQELIKEALTGWKESSGRLSLAENLESKLDAGFINSLSQLFKGELKVDFSPQIKSGFNISPLDGGFKLSFSDEDFANLFKNYLRPRSAKILFEN